ncbi:MAG: right-handed parallel beta-helix repeat-containing protein [Candidatus Thorarchaeota archaeon]|jgi:parallel beta-helix repeat protein
MGSAVRLAAIMTVLILSVNLLWGINSIQGNEIDVQTRQTSAEYTNHDPITIYGNQDFEMQGWPGNGSYSNPYIITGLSINCDDEIGIIVNGTDVYFVMSNCRLTSGGGSYGLEFWNVSNAVIESSDFVNSGFSFFETRNCSFRLNTVRGEYESGFVNCTNLEVDSCIISATLYGAIYLDILSESIIANNHVTNLPEGGFSLWVGDKCTFANNTITNCGTGLEIVISNDTVIQNNTITNCQYRGIDLYLTANTTLRQNHLYNNGLFISLWQAGIGQQSYVGDDFVSVNYDFEDNYVNSKVLGFFHELEDTTLFGDEYGQVILLNCTDVVVQAGSFNNATTGIQVFYSSGCRIEHSTIANNSDWGVYLYKSNSSVITDSLLLDNKEIGLHLEECPDSLVLNNSVRGSYTGIAVAYSNRCQVVNNSVMYNRVGISVGSWNSTITGNEVLYNDHVGISVSAVGRYNSIYDNSIGWNGYDNAIDNSGYSFWDDGEGMGNRWSDYYGIGEYEIHWYGIDHYPSSLTTPQVVWDALILFSAIAGVMVIVVVLIHRKRNQ